MTTQDISTLEPTRKALLPIAWGWGWRITLAGFVIHLFVALGSVTSSVAWTLWAIDGVAMALVPFFVLALGINRSFHGRGIEIAHVKYGYLVQQHLIKGFGQGAAWAFVWRFLVVKLLLIAAISLLTGLLLAPFADMRTLPGMLLSFDRQANPSRAHVIETALGFTPLLLAANLLAVDGVLRTLIRRPKPRFAFVLMKSEKEPADLPVGD